jgi:hypothetical protein
MRGRTISARGTGGLLAVVALVGLLALPVLAADPSPSSGVSPAAEPTAAPAATAAPTEKPGKGPKPSKAPEVDVTATGTVGTRTAANGRTEYTLTTGSTVRVLSAGPPWFWGDDHPLASYVGKNVTVAGTTRSGGDEIDVLTVNGTAIREPGRPPWAGGWKAVGERHPGWSQDKADRWKAKAEAKGVDCWPPGHCKEPGAETSGD